jgi:hypothetical protein
VKSLALTGPATRRGAVLGGVIAAALCFAAPAQAQLPASPQAPPTDRPYRSLFGGVGSNSGAKQLLELTATLAEGYDENVQAELPDATPLPAQVSGAFTAIALNLQYIARGDGAEFALTYGTNYRYFSTVNEGTTLGHALGVGFTKAIGARSNLAVNQAITYMPAYLFGMFADPVPPAIGDAAPPSGNYAVTTQSSGSYVTDATLSRRIGRRSTLSFLGGYRNTQFSGTSAQADLVGYHAGAQFIRPINRDVALRLGYVYRHTEYSNGIKPIEHDLGFGVDYDRPLSRTRRTKLGFSVGSSVLNGPPPNAPTEETVRHFNAAADVRLSHQMGRTWTARAIYKRAAQYVEEIGAPVYTDGVTVQTDGMLGRRTDLTAYAAYSVGALIGQSASDFTTQTASVRFRFGLNQRFALFAEYLYYRYDFQQLTLVSGAPSRLNRNGVQGGLTLWLPIAKK